MYFNDANHRHFTHIFRIWQVCGHLGCCIRLFPCVWAILKNADVAMFGVVFNHVKTIFLPVLRCQYNKHVLKRCSVKFDNFSLILSIVLRAPKSENANYVVCVFMSSTVTGRFIYENFPWNLSFLNPVILKAALWY